MKKWNGIMAALLLGSFLAPAAQAMPENHAQLMQEESYKKAFNEYKAVVDEAKSRFSADDFDMIAESVETTMVENAVGDIQNGRNEVDAWELAYTQGRAEWNLEMKHQWLRQHPDGAQGLFRIANEHISGYLAVYAGDDAETFEVHLSVIMQHEPYTEGGLDGFGKLKGDTLTVVDFNQPDLPLEMTLKGDSFTVKSSELFKKSSQPANGISFDGLWTRDPK